jgi:hypothetical protein
VGELGIPRTYSTGGAHSNLARCHRDTAGGDERTFVLERRPVAAQGFGARQVGNDRAMLTILLIILVVLLLAGGGWGYRGRRRRI